MTEYHIGDCGVKEKMMIRSIAGASEDLQMDGVTTNISFDGDVLRVGSWLDDAVREELNNIPQMDPDNKTDRLVLLAREVSGFKNMKDFLDEKEREL